MRAPALPGRCHAICAELVRLEQEMRAVLALLPCPKARPPGYRSSFPLALWVNGQEVSSSTWHIGVTATAFVADLDADLAALASAILQAQLYLNTHPSTQVTVFSTNPAAIQAITNLRPHQHQEKAMFLHRPKEPL